MYQRFFKRCLDIVLSLVGIVLLSIPMLCVAIAIKLDSKGPVYFRQMRMGKNNSEFEILKFRSMSTETPKDVPTHLLGDATSFITPVGKFIRKTSLDELPQLFCILKGDMSVVGPRPCLPNQTDLREKRTENGSDLLVPGLTGWAQVNGRDELPIDIKAGFDGEYAQNVNFFWDVKCIVLTVFKVLQSDGVKEGREEVVKEVVKEAVAEEITEEIEEKEEAGVS